MICRAGMLGAATLAALALATPARALEASEVQALVRAAMTAAGQPATEITIPARPLPDCPTPPEVHPFQGSWRAVELRCAAPVWKRVLRTAATASTAPRDATAPEAPQRSVLVLTRSLPKGAVIGPEDIALENASALGRAEVFDDPALVIGRRLKQGLGGGQPLLARQLETDYAVEADTPATLTLTRDGLSVTVTVLPLENGEMGEVIRLRHPVSGRELRARVIGRDNLAITANTP